MSKQQSIKEQVATEDVNTTTGEVTWKRVFTRERSVTLATLSFKKRERAYFKPLDTMRESTSKQKLRLDADGKPIAQRPATIMRVLDLEVDEERTMIVPSVLASQLSENFGEYVGKSFEVIMRKQEDKAYKSCELYLLKD